MRITLEIAGCVGFGVGAAVLAQTFLIEGSTIGASRVVAALILGSVAGLIAAAATQALVSRPLRQMIRMVARRGGNELGARVELQRSDELGELAAELNRVSEHFTAVRRLLDEEVEGHLGALEQLRHADRLATVGKLVAGIAHELGTPLTTVSARARMISAEQALSELGRTSTRIIVEQCERMTQILKDTLTYARHGGPQRRPVDILQVVRQSFSLVRPLATRNRAQLRLAAPVPELIVEVDPSKMLQVLVNLITNGIQAMPNGGPLTVIAAREHVTPPNGEGVEGDFLCLEVRDQGKGIPDEDRERIFQAFFTTKGPDEGTGLGLPIAQGIVREHGGWIEVKSEVGKGTRMRVCLPQEEATQAAQPNDLSERKLARELMGETHRWH